MTTDLRETPAPPRPRALRTFLLRPDDPTGRVRPEIQALRAVAVIVVVIYHFWPGRLPGGYVGVDVFFVISGFLIIGHLLREFDRTGEIRLVAFWARRARRLLPASLLTLVVTALAIVVWVPQLLWIQFLQEVGAAAVYVLNWLLAFDSVDYLAASNTASPVQHFWSLSVEEQFYIFWPILLVIALFATRRADGRIRRAVLVTLLVVLTAASAVYSAWATQDSAASAYFLTTTRAWEFGVGGVLAAVMMRRSRLPDALAALLSWGGLITIAATTLLFSRETPFPGVAAWLPVLGSLAVIAAGLPRAWWSPSTLARLRPVQGLGDISYSVYLWHWPPLIILPYALHQPLGNRILVVLLVAVFAVGWASKKFVEDPVRTSRRLTARGPWFTTAVAVVATVAFLGVSVGASAALEARADANKQELIRAIESGDSCLGAAAGDPERDCPRPYAVTELTDPTTAAQDIGMGVQVIDACKQTLDDSAVITCEIGDTTDPTRHIALIGDSHAGQLLESLDIYGKAHEWQITTYLKTWCIGLGVDGVAAPSNLDAQGVSSCAEWGDSALEQISSDPELDGVVFANFTQKYTDPAVEFGRPVEPADFRTAWDRLTAAGKTVVVLRDLPNAGASSAPQCIAEHLDEYDPCPTVPSVAIPASDPQWDAVSQDADVAGVDLSRLFCDDERCHTLIGGLIVYFDTHHLTATYSRTLAPFLGGEIADALP